MCVCVCDNGILRIGIQAAPYHEEQGGCDVDMIGVLRPLVSDSPLCPPQKVPGAWTQNVCFQYLPQNSTAHRTGSGWGGVGSAHLYPEGIARAQGDLEGMAEL